MPAFRTSCCLSGLSSLFLLAESVARVAALCRQFWCVILLTLLSPQAYTAYLSGMLRFEHQEWKAAIEAFNKCK